MLPYLLNIIMLCHIFQSRKTATVTGRESNSARKHSERACQPRIRAALRPPGRVEGRVGLTRREKEGKFFKTAFYRVAGERKCSARTVQAVHCDRSRYVGFRRVRHDVARHISTFAM